jgi:hypothetical protein
MGVCVFYFFVRILLSRPGPVGLDGRSGHLVGYCKYYQYSYCIAERYLAPVNFVVTHYSNWYWGFPHPRRACLFYVRTCHGGGVFLPRTHQGHCQSRI